MKMYSCSNCGYKTRKESLPKECNYCGKKNCMKEVEDAEKILDLID